jgi:hypothetical protein
MTTPVTDMQDRNRIGLDGEQRPDGCDADECLPAADDVCMSGGRSGRAANAEAEFEESA